MKFQVIKNERATQLRKPSFHVGYGYMTISKPLMALLNEPKYVKIAYDPEEKVIGITRSTAEDENSFKLTHTGKQYYFSSAALTKKVREMTDNSNKTYTFFIEGEEDGYFYAHVKNGISK